MPRPSDLRFADDVRFPPAAFACLRLNQGMTGILAAQAPAFWPGFAAEGALLFDVLPDVFQGCVAAGAAR
jgi:hypothetical protein